MILVRQYLSRAVFLISIYYYYILQEVQNEGTGNDEGGCVCVGVILFSETMKQILFTFGVRGVNVFASRVFSKMLFDSFLYSMPLHM